MKHVRCWDDLRPFGFNPLTADACGLMYRLLCDVPARGLALLQKCFGVPELQLAASWSRGTKEEPHVGAIMLSHEMMTPVALFALLESGCTEVWLCQDQ